MELLYIKRSTDMHDDNRIRVVDFRKTVNNLVPVTVDSTKK